MSDVVREFLVGLGFKIDATSERKFVEGVQKATEQALAFGAAMQAVAATITAAVVKIAREMDQVAYASERLGSSAKDIKAVSYAIGQMGGSAQGALSSMEGIARFMRNSPGGEGFIRHLVGDKVDVKDTAAVMDALAVKFREMPYYLAKARAEVIGIDEQTLQAMVRGMDKFSAEYRSKMSAAGLNQDKLASDSKKFMQTWNGMWQSVELVGQKIAANLMPYLSREIERFTAWLDANSAKISYYITRFAEAALEIATFIRDAVLRLGDMDPAIKRVVAVLALLAGAAWALGGPIRILLLLWAAIVLLYDDYKAWKAGSEHFIDWEKWEPTIKAVTSALETIGGWFKKLAGDGEGGIGALEAAFAAFAVFLAGKWLASVMATIAKVGASVTKSLGPLLALYGIYTVGKDVYDSFNMPQDEYAKKWGVERIPHPLGQEPTFMGRMKKGWQERPKWLGGTGGEGAGTAAETPQGDGKGTKGAASKGFMMRIAMDQLRREGVPEQHLRAAAAHLVGQATMESGLNPNLSHDQGTGFGIYGARDDPRPGGSKRRSKMFAWLKVNGYAPNSAEGQMRYMAYEAMNGGYRRTKQVLMGGGTGNLTADTNTITREFEAPKVTNHRAPAVAAAFRVGPELVAQAKSGAEVLGAMAKEAANARAAGAGPNAPPAIVGGAEAAKRAFDPKRFDFSPALGAAPMTMPGQTTLHQKTEINVMGGADPAATASYVERAQSGVNQNMMRNFTSQVR